MNLRSIRHELGLACGGRGFTVYDTIPGDPELPCVAVGWPSRIQYHSTLAGGAELRIPIFVAFARADDERAQELLDEALSGAIAAAIEAHICDSWVSIGVLEANNIRTLTSGGSEVIAADLIVDLITTP